MTINYVPAGLDPFTDIIAVHWRSMGVTKLDFVGHRYMVKGKDQTLEDVLGDDLTYSGFTYRNGATQRSYVTADGLDLRKGPDFNADAYNTAWLKNKTATPDKTNPGALNEFLFLDATMVIEFDYFDINALMNAQTDGGYPNGIDATFEIVNNTNQLDFQTVAISNAEQATYTTASSTELYGGSWVYPIVREPLYADDGTQILLGQYGPAVWSGTVPPDPQNWPPRPAPLWGTGIVENDYPPPAEPFFWNASVPDTIYSYTNEIAAYEYDANEPPINGRIVGGAADVNGGSYAPLANGQLSVPYGRARMAVTMSGGKLVASVNGSDPVGVVAAPLFAMPRLPPMNDAGTQRLTYFPITNHPVYPTLKTYEVSFNFPGVVRCVWLYRTKKLDGLLKKLSVVKALTPPTDPAWKTT